MKKKILLIVTLVAVFACIFALSVFAENKIIKLSTLPTLAEIHADRDAYVSHLDAFDGDSLGEIDSTSVVVLSDLAETPTYYVFPSYYYMRTTNNTVWGYLTKLNDAIAAADPTAFAGYAGIGGGWSGGGCKYLIRYEVPTYVTSFSGTSKFESDTNLKEVYFPTHIVIDEETGLEKEVAYVTSISGQNLFSSCSSLEYVHNSEFLPGGLVEGNQDGFAGCKSLKEIKIPLTATSIGLRCFNECKSLKEVVLPNSVVSVAKGAFANCTSLEKFVFGAGFNKFIRTNVDYETLQNCTNLKYVYFPATFADSIEAKANDYKNIFSTYNNKITFFVTADKAKAQEIFDKFDATNSNGSIERATLVEFNPDVDYTTYAETLGYDILVYNYSACEAFYNGEHNVSEHYSLEYSGEEFLSTAIKSKACASCTYKVDKSELGALFVSLGYSTNGRGSVIQGFSINSDMLSAYEAVLGEITYGVIAAGDTREDKTVGADVFSFEKKVFHELSGSAYDYFQVMVNGIDESKYDAYIFFCAYVQAGEKCYYINEGVTDTVATSTTYNIATA